MSRVGKKPVPIPNGVQVRIEGDWILVKGTRGELSGTIDRRIKVEVQDGQVQVRRTQEDRVVRSLHGVVRTKVNNMIVGVTDGYQKTLEVNGVGFRVQVQGQTLQLSLGFSKPVTFLLPSGINVKVEKQNMVVIQGIDKQLVGQVAADIRAIRPPEPYKGKGIKYAGEVLLRKEGKGRKA